MHMHNSTYCTCVCVHTDTKTHITDTYRYTDIWLRMWHSGILTHAHIKCYMRKQQFFRAFFYEWKTFSNYEICSLFCMWSFFLFQIHLACSICLNFISQSNVENTSSIKLHRSILVGFKFILWDVCAHAGVFWACVIESNTMKWTFEIFGYLNCRIRFFFFNIGKKSIFQIDSD